MTIRTVGDLAAALNQMPQDLPVLVGCHFDNDDGLTNDVRVRMIVASHSEDRFYYEADPNDPGTFRAVAVQ